VTRKRRPPQSQLRRIDLTATLDNPALHELEAEHSDPATWSETWQVLTIAGAGAVCGWLMASGAAWVFGLPGNALQMTTAGSVGLALLVVCAVQTSNARRVRQWATFDRQPGETVKAPDFVPVADSPRTLVLDFKLRPKVEQWARLLQADNYQLAHTRWTPRSRLFSRGEYDALRAVLRTLNYERGKYMSSVPLPRPGKRVCTMTDQRNAHARTHAYTGRT